MELYCHCQQYYNYYTIYKVNKILMTYTVNQADVEQGSVLNLGHRHCYAIRRKNIFSTLKIQV